MSDYPHIGEPQRQGDGTWAVKVERGPGMGLVPEFQRE